MIGEDQPYAWNIFTLGSCAPIVGTQVFSYEDEVKMLIEWREFIRWTDPDIITGYNILGFDFPYILNRAETLQIDKYSGFSWLKNSLSKIWDRAFSSKALGHWNMKEINIEGRIQFDMLEIIMREHKLRTYTLNSVSA